MAPSYSSWMLAANSLILVVDQSERVLASDVFEEIAFPSMSKGRVALLGDGRSNPTTKHAQKEASLCHCDA